MPPTSHLSRRTVLKTSAALAGSASALGAYTIYGSEPAQAAVELGSLNVPDANLQSPDGIPADIFIHTTGQYEYKTPADPATVEIALYHRDTSGGFNLITSASTDTTTRTGSGTFDLYGSLFDAGHYQPEDFRAPGPGKDVNVHVEMGVLVLVYDANGDELVKGRATRVVVISVTETDLSARVGAEGKVLFQEDTDDPTPTVSP